MISTLDNLPDPDEVHRELVTTLKRVELLRKLMRLSQRAISADGYRESDLTVELATHRLIESEAADAR